MSTTLPNGLEIVNVTAHELIFWDDSWSEPVIACSDAVVNASPYTRVVATQTHPVPYSLTNITYRESPEGRQILDQLKLSHPLALFIGSIIAAQAYPEEVYAPVPHSRGRKNPSSRLLKPNRFTTFSQQKENNYHGEEASTTRR